MSCRDTARRNIQTATTAVAPAAACCRRDQRSAVPVAYPARVALLAFGRVCLCPCRYLRRRSPDRRNIHIHALGKMRGEKLASSKSSASDELCLGHRCSSRSSLRAGVCRGGEGGSSGSRAECGAWKYRKAGVDEDEKVVDSRGVLFRVRCKIREMLRLGHACHAKKNCLSS